MGTSMKAMSADSKRRGAQGKVLERGYFAPYQRTRPMNANKKAAGLSIQPCQQKDPGV